MHIERLTQLAEWLEGGAKHERIIFDMSSGVRYEVREFDPTPEELTTCQTACCIAGAATQFFNKPKELLEDAIRRDGGVRSFLEEPELDWPIVRDEAMQLLGLEPNIAEALFQPEIGNLDRYSDPAWAARVIRHLIATGDVDWDGLEHVE